MRALKGEMKSLREMEEKVSEYFDMCEQSGDFPDEAGLIYHLGISRDMYEQYARGELRRYKPFALCLERAKLRRESILVREIFAASASRTPTAKLFLAKQVENGGLVEPPKVGGKSGGGGKKDEKPVVEVKMSGSGKGFFD